MSVRDYLGYHKFQVKNWIQQLYRINKYRLQGTIIQSGVRIADNVTLYKSNQIGRNVIIAENVIINPCVKIGNFSTLSNIQIGKNSHVESRVECLGSGNGTIIIGCESYIGFSNILDWSDNITIGDFVHIAGPSTGLWTHTSALKCLYSIPLNDNNLKYRPTAPIIIESNVYIGGNCTIYPGVKIGHHSIVAPNSAVTKNVEPYTMVGGVPAVKIKSILLNEKRRE